MGEGGWGVAIKVEEGENMDALPDGVLTFREPSIAGRAVPLAWVGRWHDAFPVINVCGGRIREARDD